MSWRRRMGAPHLNWNLRRIRPKTSRIVSRRRKYLLINLWLSIMISLTKSRSKKTSAR